MATSLNPESVVSDVNEEAGNGAIPSMEYNALLKPRDLKSSLKQLKAHDHVCLVYETEEEWKCSVIPFISIGLERGEKCVYVADAHTPDQVWASMSEQGIDVETARSSGRMVILDQSEAYAPDGSFDPGRMISQLIKETEKALAEGYSGLRVTVEMSWSLRGHPGSEKLMEYEKRLNRELFSQYPVLALCQYDQRKFDPQIIKGVILTHPTLIHRKELYHNSYYIPTEEYINWEYKRPEVKHLLDNLAREKEAEERICYLANALESSHEPFAAGLPDGKLILWNRAFEAFSSYSNHELRLLKWNKDLVPSDWNGTLIHTLEELNQTNQPQWIEMEFLRKDGSQIPIEIIFHLVTDSEGKGQYYYAFIKDITDRKRAEKALRESEEKYRELIHSVNSIINRTDKEGRITFMNDFGLNFFGYSEAEVIGKSMLGTIFPETDASGQNHGEKFRETILDPEKCPDHVNVNVCREGKQVWISWNIKALNDPDGNLKEFLGVGVDITELKLAEEALATERECLTVTLRSIGDGVIATDMAGRISLVNKVAERLTGWPQEQALDRSLEEVFDIRNGETGEPCGEVFKRVLETGTAVTIDQCGILKAKDGTGRMIADSCAPIRDRTSKVIGLVLVFRDITEKQKMGEEIQRTQKLESLGVMAGGIAHDFNNILTAMMGNISLARSVTETGTDLSECLEDAEKACVRAKGLTQQLLTFAKGGIPIKKVIRIKELIREAATFALPGSKSRPELYLEENLWPVEADPNQIGQVIHNLVINADQAMPEGGVVKIHGRNIFAGEEESKPGSPLTQGRYVKISVEDQGIGIPEEYLAKIFDPFFTTKQNGRGLGLATSYSIIKNHSGYLSAESKTGVGSIFYFYLPATDQPALNENTKREKRVPGSGKILVMDDEASVRAVAGAMLRNLGYSAEFAKDGNEAIKLYRSAREFGNPFNMIIMDLTIPGGMGGKDAIKKLLEIDPKVKAIVSSGYSTDPIMAEYQKYGFQGVIVKPYVIEEFSQVLRQVNNSGRESEESSQGSGANPEPVRMTAG